MGVGGERHVPAALPPETTRYPLYRRMGGPQGGSKAVRDQVPFYCEGKGRHMHTLPDSAVQVCILKVCGYRHAPAALPPGRELRVPIGEKQIHALTVNSHSCFINAVFCANMM